MLVLPQAPSHLNLLVFLFLLFLLLLCGSQDPCHDFPVIFLRRDIICLWCIHHFFCHNWATKVQETCYPWMTRYVSLPMILTFIPLFLRDEWTSNFDVKTNIPCGFKMNELATLMWKPTSHVALIHSHLRILSFGSHVPIQSLQECEFQHIQPQPCYRSFFGPGCTMSWGRMMVVQLYSSLGTHEIPPGKKVETLFNSWVHTWENRKSLKTYIEHGKKLKI